MTTDSGALDHRVDKFKTFIQELVRAQIGPNLVAPILNAPRLLGETQKQWKVAIRPLIWIVTYR